VNRAGVAVAVGAAGLLSGLAASESAESIRVPEGETRDGSCVDISWPVRGQPVGSVENVCGSERSNTPAWHDRETRYAAAPLRGS